MVALTAALVVDAGLRVGTGGVAAAADDADAIAADVTPVAGGVAVAHRAAHAVDASVVRQTALITNKDDGDDAKVENHILISLSIFLIKLFFSVF